MDAFWIQGVVKNGQVVLTEPLELPDGMVVTVRDYDPDDDPRPIEPTMRLSDEEFLELTAFLSGKRNKRVLGELRTLAIPAYSVSHSETR